MRKLKTYQNFNESTEEDVHREMMIKKYGSEEIEECDSVISDVKDMLLELNDLEIFTIIDYTSMTYMCFEKTSPKLFLNILSFLIYFL